MRIKGISKEVDMDKIKKSSLQTFPMVIGWSSAFFLFEGYDHSEISEVLGISNSASRTQYLRAKYKIKGDAKQRRNYYPIIKKNDEGKTEIT